MEVFIVAAVVVVLYLLVRKNKHPTPKGDMRDAFRPQVDILDDLEMPASLDRQVVEIIGDDGVPAFKYRFSANLDFDSPSSALQKNSAEAFIPRPNGNRDPIVEPGGVWLRVSEWEGESWALRREDERFKYIGGQSVYIDFLLQVRAVYEDRGRKPGSKRNEIQRICGQNHNVYTVRHVYRPPWDSLIVPVLSQAEGFGEHRVSLLHAAGVRSINDVESRSDKDLLAIKGIGKAAVSGLRSLVASWPYDKYTDCIERDEQYR